MATQPEIAEKYAIGYEKLYDEVKLRRGKVSDETYATLVDVANDFRSWATRMGNLKNLPELPKENK